MWQHHLFDPSQSSTFSTQPGVRFEGVFAFSGGDTIPSTDNRGANCTAVTDTLHVGDREALQQQFLLCDSYHDPLAAQLADGILGLSSVLNYTLGLWANWMTPYGNLVDSGELARPEFGFSYIETPTRAGRLTLGGTDRTLYIPGTVKTIPLDWPLSETRGSWVVGVHGARIGGALLANSTDSVTLVDTAPPSSSRPTSRRARPCTRSCRTRSSPSRTAHGARRARCWTEWSRT